MPPPALFLPWRVRMLPRLVVLFPGIVFLLSFILEPFKPNYLCGPDPWEGVNALMWPTSIVLSYMLLAGNAHRRRLGALFGFLITVGSAALLTFVKVLGPGLNLAAAFHSCGCFGPIELPYPAHMALLAGMAACLGAVFLHEETRLAEARERLGTPGFEPGS